MKSKFLKSALAMAASVTMAVCMVMPVHAESVTSELTGLPIDSSIQNQRPIAVMVDNEKVALKHYGTAEADIVYEMINSTKNKRVTRLMCIYKDWQNIGQTGSIRSIRTTNIPLAGEYNAIMIHDGGPFYIDEYLANPWANHLSGGFARIANGKAREFTEYVTADVLKKKISNAKISSNYNEYAPARRNHFQFFGADTQIGGTAANNVDLSGAFWHNSSKLAYNASTGTYDYSEYGSLHTDAEDGQVLTFKNVILQNVSVAELDANGYMNYNTIGSGDGYYCTNGQVIPIRWNKSSMTGATTYTNASGAEISINPGKTYIGLIPSDTWGAIVIN